MKLVQLLDGIVVRAVHGDLQIEVGELRDDSRAILLGDVFVAIAGQSVDGHAFIERAEALGARAVIVERQVTFSGTQVVVESTGKLLAQLAQNRYGHPDRALRLIGVTGTNGKTTTTFLVEAILAAAGRSTGVIGTVTYRWAGKDRPAPFTTPGPIALQQTFAAMLADGVSDVAMECSSHAIEQGRLDGLSFSVAAFTNLTQDHLDFHGSMTAYRDSKAKLFRERLARDGSAVILVDREEANFMAAASVGRVLRVSARNAEDADLAVLHSQSSLEGTVAELRTPSGSLALRSPLVGAFNLENLVVACGIGFALGISASTIAAALATANGAPGRLERVRETEALSVYSFVDYAHTPDALERVLTVLRPLTARRLIVVFGCGGDRDRSKRAIMGGIGARLADLAIITSDNPRTEAPESILVTILEGASRSGKAAIGKGELLGDCRGYYAEGDRRTAIDLAVRLAQPGDVIVVAGKGHEDYQILGKTKHPFDDRQELRRAVATKAS